MCLNLQYLKFLNIVLLSLFFSKVLFMIVHLCKGWLVISVWGHILFETFLVDNLWGPSWNPITQWGFVFLFPMPYNHYQPGSALKHKVWLRLFLDCMVTSTLGASSHEDPLVVTLSQGRYFPFHYAGLRLYKKSSGTLQPNTERVVFIAPDLCKNILLDYV